MGEFDEAEKYFAREVTSRDRAIFEGGITLGAIYHQVSGFPMPRSLEEIRNLEELIEKTFINQPYIENLKITIHAREPDSKNPYNYEELSGKNFSIFVISTYKNVRVHFKMDLIKELNYPLMRIVKIEERPILKS
ncbi:MAG: dihydroneopterin aldolase family protein [Candidatus Helarchaeota archaeon]